MNLEKAIEVLKDNDNENEILENCGCKVMSAIDTVLSELDRLKKSEEDLMIKAGKIACEMSLEIDKLKTDLYSANCIIDDLATVTRDNKIKDEYLLLIDMMLYDYDGCKTVKSLKELIDEVRDYIHKALKNDDKSVITVNSKKKFNILGEEVE